jgi:hypothetical protein
MDHNRIAIRTGVTHIGGRDQRCKRAACIYPSPTIRFDLEGRHIVAAWSWVGIRMITVPNGIRVAVVPTMLLVPISSN